MRKKSLYLSLLLFLVACESSGVKTTEKTAVKKQKSVDNRSQAERLLDPAKTIVDKKEFPNGLKIQWFKKFCGNCFAIVRFYRFFDRFTGGPVKIEIFKISGKF
jgi:hypothetical protein